MFSKKDLDVLIGEEKDPAISIFMPTVVAGRETRQGHIRLDNLIREASKRLIDAGLRDSEVDAITRPAQELVKDTRFWRLTDKGLAIFLAPGVFHCHRVPLDLAEEVVVAHRFHVTPLIPLLLDDERFALVAVSAAGVRLYDGSKSGLSQVETPEMPDGLQAVMDESQYELNQNVASPARPQLHRGKSAAQGHGFPAETPGDQARGPSPEETHHAMLVEYIRRAAGVVDKHLSGFTHPVLLAGTPEMVGEFRAVARGKTVMDRHLDVNPDGIGVDELHGKAWEMIGAARRSDADQAVEQFESLFNDGDDRATVKPEEIVKGARYGRVDCLIVAEGEHLWGHYDEGRDTAVSRGGAPSLEDEDLINYAAVHTIKNGGVVRLMPKDRMPRGGVAAAIMRYGFDPDRPFEKSPE